MHPQMNVLFYLTILPPALPGCEAVTQEIAALRTRLGGTLIYVNPNDRSPLYVPRLGFGFHKLHEIRGLESDATLHHFFNPDPFPFPFLRLLRRPVVYSLTGALGPARPSVHFLSSLAAITVADQRSLERLQSWGLGNVELIRPGIDTSPFSWTPPPSGPEVWLMVGSAPWTRAQFGSKGVDALLQAAQRQPRLHLVFLWRGVLYDAIAQRVHQLGIKRQVRILNERVDVNQVLAGVHASIALASDPAIVRPYPHSLIESLSAGKPVLVSRSIPMADYVELNGCGQVVETVTTEGILAAVDALVDGYDDLAKATRRAPKEDFAQDELIASYQHLYERVLADARPVQSS